MAPEMNERYKGDAVDIFSLGVILFEIYTGGKQPFLIAKKSNQHYKWLYQNTADKFWEMHSAE